MLANVLSEAERKEIERLIGGPLPVGFSIPYSSLQSSIGQTLISSRKTLKKKVKLSKKKEPTASDLLALRIAKKVEKLLIKKFTTGSY